MSDSPPTPERPLSALIDEARRQVAVAYGTAEALAFLLDGTHGDCLEVLLDRLNDALRCLAEFQDRACLGQSLSYLREPSP